MTKKNTKRKHIIPVQNIDHNKAIKIKIKIIIDLYFVDFPVLVYFVAWSLYFELNFVWVNFVVKEFEEREICLNEQEQGRRKKQKLEGKKKEEKEKEYKRQRGEWMKEKERARKKREKVKWKNRTKQWKDR